jgi:hypothetical protein
MKKLSLLIFLLIIGMSSYAQEYHKLIRTDTYWDEFSVVLPEMCYTTITRYSFTNNDTTLAGNSYRINKCYTFKSINPGPLCPPFVIDTTPFISWSFFREDTINRKVYIYCDGCPQTQKDQLFYDFSLSIGDTLNSGEQTLFGEPLILTSIDTVTLLNGEKRKKYGFANSPSTIYYIEGIGGSQGLDLPIVEGMESYGGYLCISQSGINLWGDKCNNYFMGIDPRTNDGLNVFPNPAHEILNIQLPKMTLSAKFEILDISGKEILTTRLNHPNTTLSILGFNPGSYIWRIKTDSSINQGKLIIF